MVCLVSFLLAIFFLNGVCVCIFRSNITGTSALLSHSSASAAVSAVSGRIEPSAPVAPPSSLAASPSPSPIPHVVSSSSAFVFSSAPSASSAAPPRSPPTPPAVPSVSSSSSSSQCSDSSRDRSRLYAAPAPVHVHVPYSNGKARWVPKQPSPSPPASH